MQIVEDAKITQKRNPENTIGNRAHQICPSVSSLDRLLVLLFALSPLFPSPLYFTQKKTRKILKFLLFTPRLIDRASPV